ncbi:MAG: PAS domain-containing protein [Bacteroidales bacterium]|nr:PAS domain-containing protein [Bacteroidales bacterium]
MPRPDSGKHHRPDSVVKRSKSSRRSRDHFFAEQIIDSSRSMITIINRDYVYEKVNKTFCLNHNRSPETVVGKKLEEIWGRENFHKNIKDNIDYCFTGKVVFYQAFFETPAWGRRYYEVVLRPVRDDKEAVTHVLAETSDITEIKLKEQAASEIEWEFRNLESNLPIGFFRCDNEGVMLHVNKAFLRIIGADSENEINGKPLRDFYRDQLLFDLHLLKLKNEGVASFGRLELKAHDGTLIICRINAFTVRDGSGNPVYIDGAMEDFTREADLEKRLIQSQKLDTIGMLAGGIAHDFNTILTTIYGYSELSLETLDKSSEAYNNIRKILQAAGRARSLTNQILTFSRHAGQERITVRVSDIISETIGSLRPVLPSGIEVIGEIKAPDLYVSADPTQLYRVFVNLVRNAIQAMDDKGGTLTITLDTKHCDRHGRLPDGTYVLVRFADTGQGMDERTAGRIFEPFFTAGKQGQGTGLGLSVVYGIISEIDGEITVSSRVDEGTVIDILIPVAGSVSDEFPAMASRAGIMIISGSDSESRLIAMALSGSGYHVSASDTSGEWIAKACKADAIVVMDNSPAMPATDIIYSLATHGVESPVLMISDFDVWLTAEKELTSGLLKSNLFKPASLKEIIYSIDNMINKTS